MYGWVKVDDKENAIGVSVKVPISNNPFEEHAIVGTFWFKKVDFLNSKHINPKFMMPGILLLLLFTAMQGLSQTPKIFKGVNNIDNGAKQIEL